MPKRPKFEILFEDADYVAVNKPYGLAVIPGRAESTSLLEELAAQLNLPASGTTDPRLRIVHRLDKDTSGVLLLAKNLPAQRHVAMQFQNNQTEKQYLALVAGRPSKTSGHIDAPLATHPARKLEMAVATHGGRPAITDWQVEHAYRHYALVRVFPRTGKTHQIRVHLKHVGMPLAVDPLYSPLPSDWPVGIFLSSFKRDYRPTHGEEERALISRLTLHAERLTFQHLDGRKIELVATPPKDFRATVNTLGKYG